jgi:uncharacterized RDD family membrane protein YckC
VNQSASAPAAMTGQVTLGNGQIRTLASPGKRLVARLIDACVMWVAATVVAMFGFGSGLALGATGTDAGLVAGVMAFVAAMMTIVLVSITYEVTMTALKGQTVGKMVMSIHVARADNGELPGWGKAVGRWALPTLLGLIPLVGWIGTLLTYLSLTWDDRRQGWHDKAAGTVVTEG